MSHPSTTDGALSLHALPDESPVEVQFSEVRYFKVRTTVGALRAAATADPGDGPNLAEDLPGVPFEKLPFDVVALLGTLTDQQDTQPYETDGTEIGRIVPLNQDGGPA